MMSGRQARLLGWENTSAYLTVLAAWVCVSAVFGAGLKVMWVSALTWPAALGWALAAVMAGMAIMFVASVLNLRKMRRGFQRMARGERDPEIPPVWCPVLTMATRAAVELQRSLQKQRDGREDALR